MTSADGFNPAKPDGRWARVLRAANGDAPVTSATLHRAARIHGEGRTGRKESLKTMKTIRHLITHGLLAKTAQGFITTGAGQSALALADTQRTAA